MNQNEDVKKQFRKFLGAAIDAENLEANPIMQDYMTPELVDYLDGNEVVVLTEEEYNEVAKALAVFWEEVVKGSAGLDEYLCLSGILAKFGIKCAPQHSPEE